MPDRLVEPTHSKASKPTNRILAALPGRDWASVQPYLQSLRLERGRVLFDVDEPLARIYFIETGVAGLLSAFEDGATGVAVVGQEGAVDLATLLLGGDAALGRCLVLLPGRALSLEISAFRTALRKSSTLRAACENFARALFVQMLQAVPCNRLHTAEQRCARWLLMCTDRMKENAPGPTQKSLAEMVGVPHSTLTSFIGRLQNAGVVCSRGGAVTVLDRQALEAVACECYGIVRNRYDQLFARPID